MQKNRILGARIKAAMKAAGFATAREFCKKLNIPHLTFSQHTQGRRYPRQDSLKLYSKAFGVTVHWLETGEGNPLIQENRSKNKAIKTIFEGEVNKSQIHKNGIDPTLLEKILAEVIILKTKYHLSEKKCAHITTNLYTQITAATDEKILQKKMVYTFIKTYEATFKN